MRQGEANERAFEVAEVEMRRGSERGEPVDVGGKRDVACGKLARPSTGTSAPAQTPFSSLRNVRAVATSQRPAA